MPKIFFSLLFLVLTACSSQVVVNDDLYVKIAGEVICSSTDNEAEIYQKYGVTSAEIEAYKTNFSKDPQHQQAIAKRILQVTMQCYQ
jgi:hypothetical protein